MPIQVERGLIALSFLLFSAVFASGQILPGVTTPPTQKPPTQKPPAEKPHPAKLAQITIDTSPNAQVYLDGVLKGKTNPEGRLVIPNLTPGTHKVRVVLAGKKEFTQDVQLSAGQEESLPVKLADLMGSLLVRTVPGAKVFLDTASQGTASASGQLAIANVTPGSHELRITAQGKKEHLQSVTTTAGQETQIDAMLTDATGSIRVHTTPSAGVSLDDANRGTTDANGLLEISAVAEGSHHLRISAHGMKENSQAATVVAGQETKVEAVLAVAGPTPGEARENPRDGLKYVWIPPGVFQMGCSPEDDDCEIDEKPAHQVTLRSGFWLGQTEVTVGAYKRFASSTGLGMPEPPTLSGKNLNPGWSKADVPIVEITWDDAQAYCAWAGGRLPTEAEWEYAARGGTTNARYDRLDDIAWTADNSGQTRLDSAALWQGSGGAFREGHAGFTKALLQNGNAFHPGGQKRANAFGLFDMLGNVWEWVNDWYDEHYYSSNPAVDPQGPGKGTARVLRGGSWSNIPKLARVSGRLKGKPGGKEFNGGTRCVWKAAP